MGVSHQSLQEYSIALDYYKKALEIQNKVLPPTHPDIATTYNSMATVLVSLGDFEGALENEKHAVDIASRTLTPDHPNLITFRNYYERINAKVESMK
jgi:tetratricopeptide (TPR) repeat protein